MFPSGLLINGLAWAKEPVFVMLRFLHVECLFCRHCFEKRNSPVSLDTLIAKHFDSVRGSDQGCVSLFTMSGYLFFFFLLIIPG